MLKKNRKKKARVIKQKRSTIFFLSIALLVTLVASASILAFKGSLEKGSVAGSLCAVLPLQPKVLQIEYYPKNAASFRYLDPVETGFQNKRVIDQEAYVKNISNELLTSINEATKFHGYKDPAAPQFLKYTIAAVKKYYSKIPRGYLLNPDTGVYRPDYNQILTQNNICDYVDNKGVTEVWMFGYHFGAIEPDESRMSSKYGDISNSWPKEEQLPAQYRIPLCNKPYVLYNYNYDRTSLEMLHNKIHQLENILAYADRTYPPTLENTARGSSSFWGNFSEYVQSTTNHNSYRSSCGNAHYAPNWSSMSDEYRYDLQTMKENNCETWNPDPSKSVYKMANCSQWGCTEKGYYMWYLQNMPGYNNGIEYNGQRVRNWWEALYNPVEFLDQGTSLMGESTYTCMTPIPLSATPVLTTVTSKPVTTLTKAPTSVPTKISTPTLAAAKPSVVTQAALTRPIMFKSAVNPNNNTVSVIYRWSTSNSSCKDLPNIIQGPVSLTGKNTISPNNTSVPKGVSLPRNSVIYYCASITYGANLVEYGAVMSFTSR